ncbi:hypothetical protein COAQ111491_11715 [Comamonas aquatilis]|uniref:hypothetical protein n=1 Tax=Comamonas aquatilis TaxID=1778406 RepID=UPI0039EFCD21
MNKPNLTTNNANRAYVRLHTYVTKLQAWEDFAKAYCVVLDSKDSEGASQCVVQVLDKVGQPAALGPKIPNQITFSSRKAPAMAIWTECFNDGKFSWRNVSCR